MIKVRKWELFDLYCNLKIGIYYIKVSGIPNGNKLIKTIRYPHMWRYIISSHVKISMISLLSSLSLKLYLNLLVYLGNIFRSCSKISGNLRKSSNIFENSRKMFGNVCLAFGTILENLRKSSESGRKSSETHQKSRHHWLLYNKKNITR